MEGFLSLEQAAERLGTPASILNEEIEAGRVVAILRDGAPWLSLGEVSRLAQARAQQTSLDRSAPSAASQAASDSRVRELEQRNAELEELAARLRSGLEETEATLRRSRTARTNLENDIVGLQDQLHKSRSRSDALEREIQRLTNELEKVEEHHNLQLRRLRSKDRKSEPSEGVSSEDLAVEVQRLCAQMEEKDRAIAEWYQERGQLRAQLEDTHQKLYELRRRYEKEKSEWSEILAREIQNHGHLRQQLEDLKPKANKGWNPFRRER